MAGKRVLEEPVKSNESLTITIATLTDTNSRLSKKCGNVDSGVGYYAHCTR